VTADAEWYYLLPTDIGSYEHHPRYRGLSSNNVRNDRSKVLRDRCDASLDLLPNGIQAVLGAALVVVRPDRVNA
jgi:hypothetical protein